MMEGAALAKWYVNTYLASDVPSRLITYRNHWERDSDSLPNPVKYLTYEPQEIAYWPLLYTICLNTSDMRWEDSDESMNPNFRVTYNMRTYLWVRAEGEEATTDSRDRLTTVVRESLLDGPALSSVDVTGHCNAKIDIETMQESFSDLSLIKGERYLAGAYLSYDLGLNETVERDADYLLYNIILSVDIIDKIPSAPTRPLGIVGDGQILLAWRAPGWDGGDGPLLGYQIEYSTDAGSNWSVVVADTDTTNPSYLVTGLTNGTTYYFRVAAFNSQGTGAVSPMSRPYAPTA